MIKSFKHKGLKNLFINGSKAGLPAENISKIKRILFRLHYAKDITDLNLPGFRLHQLKGDFKDYWSVTVTGNYRIIFKFNNTEATEIDYIDYH